MLQNTCGALCCCAGQKDAGCFFTLGVGVARLAEEKG